MKKTKDKSRELKQQEMPKPRFVKKEHEKELIDLWHLARTALAGEDTSPYRRMIWASATFSKRHPYVSPTGAYKDLEILLA